MRTENRHSDKFPGKADVAGWQTPAQARELGRAIFLQNIEIKSETEDLSDTN